MQPPRLPYAAALDGLRAVAVIAVIGYHLDLRWMRGGFLGVDLFFVISGFLITRLLLDESTASGRIALGGFWVRRFRRLVPPMVVVVAASVVATRLWGLPGQWQAMRGDTVAALGYVANWRFVLDEASYFETLAGPSPLRHLWSLAVEEQWYLLWPIVMLALTPLARSARSRARVGVGLVAAAVVSAIWMAVLFDPADVSRVYFGTDTRAQQLLIGAALAWITVAAAERFGADRLVVVRRPAVLALLGFVVAVVTVDDEAPWLYHGGLLALSCAAAVLVAAASLPGSHGPLRWLASPPLVAIGKRSYGLYLWHWPVLVFVGPPIGLELAALPLAAVQIATAVTLNEAMYRWVETPVRLGVKRPRNVLVGWSLGGAATAVAAVSFLATDVGRLPDIDVLRPDLATLEAASPPPSPSPTSRSPASASGSLETPPGAAEQRPPRLQPAVSAAPVGAGGSERLTRSLAPRLLLVGDSTALVMGVDKPDELPKRWRSIEYAQLGCAITDGDTIDAGSDTPTRRDNMHICRSWAKEWTEIAAMYHPDVTVIMIGAWEVLDHVVEGVRFSFPDQVWTDHVESAVRRGIAVATNGGGKAVLLRLPCMEQTDQTLVPASARNDRERVAAFNAILERVAASTPGVSTLPLDELLCPNGVFLDSIDGEQVRFDGVHLTLPGVEFVWNWLEQELVPFEPPVS